MTSSPNSLTAKCRIHKWLPHFRIRVKWLERPVVYEWRCVDCHHVKRDDELRDMYVNAGWNVYYALSMPDMLASEEVFTDAAAPTRKGRSRKA